MAKVFLYRPHRKDLGSSLSPKYTPYELDRIFIGSRAISRPDIGSYIMVPEDSCPLGLPERNDRGFHGPFGKAWPKFSHRPKPPSMHIVSGPGICHVATWSLCSGGMAKVFFDLPLVLILLVGYLLCLVLTVLADEAVLGSAPFQAVHVPISLCVYIYIHIHT